MKKMFAAALAAFLIPLALHAQVVDFGLAAGYSMNNEALHLKGSSPTAWLGVNHGFYAGPQVNFNIGKDFSIRTGLYFRQAGSDFFLDMEKLTVNLNQISNDVELGSRKLFDYLQQNPDLEITDGVTAADVIQGMDTYHAYVDQALETMKGTDLTAKVSRFDLTLPVLLRYTAGRFSFSLGVNVNLMVANKVRMSANLPNGLVYSDKDLERIFPYVHMLFTQIPPMDENPVMSASNFYSLDIARDVSVSMQCGLDYAITDRVSLQLSYLHGLSSDVKSPWTDMFTVTDRALQAGLVYHFKFKKK